MSPYSGGSNTPAHSTYTGSAFDTKKTGFSSPKTVFEACPWPETTYLIRHAETGFVIGLKDGTVDLFPQAQTASGGNTGNIQYILGSHWRCIESMNGWIGFRNAISGTYLGHNDFAYNLRVVAGSKQHRLSECIVTRQHPNGGYVLLCRHNDCLRPLKVVRDEDDNELVIGDEGDYATRWEFIKVDS